MLADILKKDIRQYAARGVVFTPEDIVRLNALAVQVKLVQHPCTGVHLPRCVFLPATSRWGAELVLREPTIAHELWLEQAARWIDTDDGLNFLYLHGYALSVLDPDELPDAYDAKAVVRRVFRFAAKRLVRYTREHLTGAIDYVLFGADWTAGEVGEGKRKKEEGRSEDGPDPSSFLPLTSSLSPTLGLISRARAMRLPITLDDAKRMTASELAEAVCEAMVADGGFDAADARNRAMGAYIRTRDAIVARIKQEQEGAAK